MSGHPRSGLDIGVQTLCLVLHLWPGVFTINSCSGYHEDCLIDGQNASAIASYVSDDAKTLAAIQAIVEKGDVGMQFTVVPSHSSGDRLSGDEQAGFVNIACHLDEGKPSQCRTMCREIILPSTPYDSLDSRMATKGLLDRGRNSPRWNFGLGIESHDRESSPRVEPGT
jgi:hypothetical protein